MATQVFTNAVRQRRDAPPRLLVGQDSATATSARAVLVDGDGHMQVDVVSLAGVKVEVANLEVQIEAVPDDLGEKSDSCLVGGTTDGSWDTTKAKCVKVAADGAVEVVQPTAGDLNCTEANSGSIKTAVEKLATEVVVGDGIMVRSDTAANMLTTEANSGSIKTAVEKVATEVGVGTGLLVRQGTATNLKCEEASAATIATNTGTTATNTGTTATNTGTTATNTGSIKTAVELIDDAVVATDAAAAAKNMQAGLVAYADPSVLPADVSANGDSVPAAGSRKGEVYAYLSRIGYGEDPARNVMRTERQGTAGGRRVASGAVVAAGTAGRMYAIIIEGGAGGITVNLRQDGVVGGTIIFQFVVGVNTYASIDLHDWPYGNGLYAEIAAGGGAYNVLFRNDT